MHSFLGENIDGAGQWSGNGRNEHSKAAIIYFFHDKGRHQGILDLYQRGLPLAPLALSRSLSGHTANNCVSRDFLKERILHSAAHRLLQFGAEDQADEDAKRHHPSVPW